MKQRQSLGLVVEGNSTSSAVLRLPCIAEELGPIKSGALRIARRVSNFLRAGYAVSTYDELQSARLILLRAPDSSTPRIVDELCSSGLVLRDVCFALCDSFLDASVLEPLQTRGSSVATVLQVQSFRQRWFVVEGQLVAVRQVRRLLDRSDARTFELRPGSKPLYFAAHMLTTVLPLDLFATAQKALRTAGLSGNKLHDLLGDMCAEMFRSFSNGARASQLVQNRLAREKGEDYLSNVRLSHPELALAIDHHFRQALNRHEVAED